jgi:uncharacterized RDD family membrane protein YckC
MNENFDKYPDAKDARTTALDAPPPLDPPPPPPPPGVVVGALNVDTVDDRRSESPVADNAAIGSRIGAAVIDFLVSTGIMITLALILPAFGQRLAWLAGYAYLVTRDSLPFLGGQSVGKKAMKLKVVTRDGTSLVGNWNAALIRNAVLLIPVFPLIELVVLLTREDKPDKGLRLGDEWAKTRVVSLETSKP